MTDHIEEATTWLAGYDELVSREGLTDATILASPLAAMAHATLALAEQQRIANLLAVGQFTWSQPTASGIPTTLSLTLDGAREALLEAQRALGFKDVPR
ncbi:hypothetical protein [Rathayibacter sp. Leaf248]|uniref:hypothetical protein n=1 Tax=Rathayibacter sp. Leaf248 TaxID=2876555 RepID=UPI001E302654|nr:hypothetical protein [Rathayibacter sp. Leaf248]